MKMVKVIVISLAALIVLLVAAAVIAVNVIDVNRFKPQIIEQAGKALSRRVDFQSVRPRIGFNGVGLKINGLTVGEDPGFGKGDFFSVKSVSVGVDALAYLFRREIAITGVVIDQPDVTLIRARDGAVNAQTIAQPPAQPGQAAPGQAQPAAAAIPLLTVSSLKVQNGNVKYIDRSFDPPLSMEVKDLSLNVSRLSLSDPFPFSAEARVLGNQQNVRVEGKCRLDPDKLNARIFDLKASADLSRVNLTEIAKSIPVVPAQALPQELKGSLELTLKEAVAGTPGLVSLDAAVSLDNGLAKFKEMAVPVKDIAARGRISEKDLLLDSFSASVGRGTVKASGRLKDYLAGQDYDFAFSAEKLSIADLAGQEQLPVKAEGMLSANGRVKGRGFTAEALRQNLAGEANADVAGARLKGVNVLAVVLDRLAIIPGLGESIKSGLPEEYQQKLRQKDTVFSDFIIPATIANGRVIIQDTAIASEGLFTFKGKGEAGFDGAYTLEGSFFVAPELSQAMAGRVGQLQYLLNEQQMLFIPLKVSGSAGERMQFNVDAAYITRKLLENQARQQILKGLDKIFGGQEQGPPPEAQGQGQQSQAQPQQGERQEVREAVDKLLKGIFK